MALVQLMQKQYNVVILYIQPETFVNSLRFYIGYFKISHSIKSSTEAAYTRFLFFHLFVCTSCTRLSFPPCGFYGLKVPEWNIASDVCASSQAVTRNNSSKKNISTGHLIWIWCRFIKLNHCFESNILFYLFFFFKGCPVWSDVLMLLMLYFNSICFTLHVKLTFINFTFVYLYIYKCYICKFYILHL